MAVWYCREVDAGNVPACIEETQACRRFLEMRDAAATGRSAYVWSDAHALDICSFIESLPHIKGFTGTIVLEPVQCWWLCGIFGFRERETGLRWVRSARVWIPRKNGKTTLATGVVMFCLLYEDEIGAEGVISAGSEEQARKPLSDIRETLARCAELRQETGADDVKDEIRFRKFGAKLGLAHSRARNLDGLNLHVLMQEEMHAQDQDVIGVLKTAQGSRRAPIDIGISTAGRDINAAAYDDWKMCRLVLAGSFNAPRLFTVMYAGTEEDRDACFTLPVVEKLNPLWGVSLNPTSIEEEKIEANKSESKRQEYLRTRINFWSRSSGNLISAESWDRCANPRLKLDTLKGFPLYAGLDLASRNDLNAAAFAVSVGGKVYATASYWLGAQSARMRDDRFADAFTKWHGDGWLSLTPGSFIDYRVILREFLASLEGHKVVGVALDDYQANIMAAEIEAAGYRTFIVRKNAKSLTPATEDLTSRVDDSALFEHDGNPITAWCAGNVVGFYDQNSNVLPKKEKPNSKANIDGIDALILANAIRIDHEAGALSRQDGKAPPVNPYLERGLLGVK